MTKYFFILIVILIVASQYMLTLVEFDHSRFYSFARFELHSELSFEDTWQNEGFEQTIYAYKIIDDYIYTYGKSGITIVSLRPLFPTVIKLPNREYYRQLELSERSNIYKSSLDRLAWVYWPNFRVIDNINELRVEEQNIIKELYEKGQEKAERDREIVTLLYEEGKAKVEKFDIKK